MVGLSDLSAMVKPVRSFMDEAKVAQLESLIKQTELGQKQFDLSKGQQTLPYDLERLGLANEQTDLSLDQGRADRGAGVPGLRSQETASKLRNALEQEDQNKVGLAKAKITLKGSIVSDITAQIASLSQNPDLNGTLQEIRQALVPFQEEFPDILQTFDQGAAQVPKRYGNNKEAFLKDVQDAQQKFARAKAMLDPKYIQEIDKEAMQGQTARDVARIGGQYDVAAAGVRAANSGSTTPTRLDPLAEFKASLEVSYPGEINREKRERTFRDYLSKSYVQTKSSQISSLEDEVTNRSLEGEAGGGNSNAAKSSTGLPPGAKQIGTTNVGDIIFQIGKDRYIKNIETNQIDIYKGK